MGILMILVFVKGQSWKAKEGLAVDRFAWLKLRSAKLRESGNEW
jgi:hypothetical protein